MSQAQLPYVLLYLCSTFLSAYILISSQSLPRGNK